MDAEEKQKMIESLTKGAKIGTFIMENNAPLTVNNNFEGKENAQDLVNASTLTIEILTKAVNAVKSMFWGVSSNAVIFCVCRDVYHLPMNMSQFEQILASLDYQGVMEYKCSEGTLSNAFRWNSYMEKPIDKWESLGAKKRVLKLRDEFINAVEVAKEK